MKKIVIACLGLVLFCSHDMYLKMDTYFLEPNQPSTLQLYNGTFEKSENTIDRNRMRDARLVGNGKSFKISDEQWSVKDSTTILSFQTGDSGTWLAGVSTKPRNIEMKAEDFNDYLKHDGVLDMLEQRRENDALETDAVEKYSKHVKAIFQVGDTTTEDWTKALAYPLEFVPLSNPYGMHTGDELQIKLLLKGKPLADHFVYADYIATKKGHTHDGDGQAHSHGEEAHDHPHGEEAQKHSHSEGAQGHSHEDAEAENSDHSHDTGGEHKHPHENVDNEKPGHSHNSGDIHGHSHKKADEQNHGHSHANDHDEGQKHSHEHANSDNHSHSPTHSERHELKSKDKTKSDDHQHFSGQQLRTDQKGILNLKLAADGIWYLRTIHMTTTEETGLTHESNWATLTFEVTHGHGHDEGADGHVHAKEDGFPSYIFWIGSLVVLGGLFFWFSRKSKA